MSFILLYLMVGKPLSFLTSLSVLYPPYKNKENMLTFITNTRYNEVIARATTLEHKVEFERIFGRGKKRVTMGRIGHNHFEARFKLRKVSSEKQERLFNLMDNHASFYVEKWDKE